MGEINWRRAATDAVGAIPIWHDRVPNCDERCPHHDGKRCQVIGFKAPSICEPVVAQMGMALDLQSKLLRETDTALTRFCDWFAKGFAYPLTDAEKAELARLAASVAAAARGETPT